MFRSDNFGMFTGLSDDTSPNPAELNLDRLIESASAYKGLESITSFIDTNGPLF